MENKDMLFVLIGFVAGSIFGVITFGNYTASELVKDRCGTCEQNLETMVNNFNILYTSCGHYQLPKAKDDPLFPSITNQTVKAYVP